MALDSLFLKFSAWEFGRSQNNENDAGKIVLFTKSKGWRGFIYLFNGWRQQIRRMSHGRQAVSSFDRTAFGEKWFWAEAKWFHRMIDTWHGTVWKPPGHRALLFRRGWLATSLITVDLRWVDRMTMGTWKWRGFNSRSLPRQRFGPESGKDF